MFICVYFILQFFLFLFFFFFNDTATTEIYTLSLHDALPISSPEPPEIRVSLWHVRSTRVRRSEEHTSELQSRENLVCRLLLEKKKKNTHEPLQNKKTKKNKSKNKKIKKK